MGNFENLFMLGWNLEASGLEIIHREQIASLTFFISRVWAACDHPLAMMAERALTLALILQFNGFLLFCYVLL